MNRVGQTAIVHMKYILILSQTTIEISLILCEDMLKHKYLNNKTNSELKSENES